MEQSSRALLGSYIQTCLLLGIAPQYPANTTINEKLGINATSLPTSTDRPTLSYYIIGNKGHRLAATGDGIYKPEPTQHRATDAALYGQFPFILRTPVNDLNPTERAKYILRKTEVHDGVTYVAYYGKRLDKSGVVPSMLIKTVSNGVTTTTPFVPSASNLNPTPPTITSNGTNTIDGTYVVAAANVPIALTAAEMDELRNVGNVIWGDEGLAIISEIGLCTGVDKPLTVAASGGGTFQFNDAIGVQMTSFINALIPASFSNNGVGITLSVGATEPIFAVSNTGVSPP